MTDLEKYLTELLVETDKTSQMQATAIKPLTTSQQAQGEELKMVKAQLTAFKTSLQPFKIDLENGLRKLN